MTIIPITLTEPACYGLMCPQHEHCRRYHAAEGEPVQTVMTCEDAAGDRPMFVEAREQARAA